MIFWSLSKVDPAALTAGNKSTWIRKHNEREAWREFAFACTSAEGRESEGGQKYRQINVVKETQTDGQTGRRGHAEEDLWETEREKESWTSFSCCFHPCLSSIMTQHWPSNDTVEETKETQIYAHTAAQHRLITTSTLKPCSSNREQTGK